MVMPIQNPMNPQTPHLWLIRLRDWLRPFLTSLLYPPNGTARDDAKSRLKLVLLHDRTQISPTLMEDLRDELVQVISKYVEIDQSTLDLCLEQEANTIALVANIAVIRAKEAAS